ncbi:MAG: hypothetical protein WDZ49_14315 [Litorilinea sp.]
MAEMRLDGGDDLVPLTRKEFYDLAQECHDYAVELARHEQHQVHLKHCYQFNEWLARVRRYDLLASPLKGLQPARPIARWQVMTLVGGVGLALMLALPGRVSSTLALALPYTLFFCVLILIFVPERLYGTTIELLEAKVLRVVETLEQFLMNEELGFTEAAFFKVKDNLEFARRELRQQIDLAHRRWR